MYVMLHVRTCMSMCYAIVLMGLIGHNYKLCGNNKKACINVFETLSTWVNT